MLLAGDNSTDQPPPQRHSIDYFMSMPYKCDVCDRRFPTYQALGGHKSGHRKNTPPSTVDHPATTFEFKSNEVKGAHECDVCHMTFATGQALGGHKRRHYDGGRQRSGAHAVRGQPRDFDLNLPACPE